MMQIPNNSGTLVPATEAALVTSGNMTDLELLLPATGKGSLPDLAAFLAACAMRFHCDPNFVQDQLHWLESMHDRRVDEGLKPSELNSANDI